MVFLLGCSLLILIISPVMGQLCLGHQTVFTTEDHMKAFVDGPCSPVVYIHGTNASMLQGIIDCDVLKSQSPEVFKACGWTDCNGENSPKSEYRVYPPPLEGPNRVFDNEETPE